MAHMCLILTQLVASFLLLQTAQAGNGYIYDKPEQQLNFDLRISDDNEKVPAEVPLDAAQQNETQLSETQLSETQLNETQESASQKPAIQMDYLDDLIEQQKEIILSSLNFNNGPLISNLLTGNGLQGGSLQGGSLQGGSLQGGSLQGGSLQGGSLLGGLLQGGLLQGGLQQGGSLQGGSDKASPFKKCANCNCGVPNGNRIVGGQEVRTNKYPWIAQMLKGAFLFCGGTLISDLYVLTAAHCVHGQDSNVKITVRLLQLDRTASHLGITRSVSKIIEHPDYSTGTLVNDIALLKLNQPVPLVNTMRPVCLPTSAYQNFDYKKAVVAGWGLTQENGQTSSVLQEVEVPIITNAECRKTDYKTMIQDTMLCAGHVLTGGKDACQGDSGGPLIVRDKIYRLAGVVSFGYGCAQANAPGVYTRVSRYNEWIGSNTMDSCYCRS